MMTTFERRSIFKSVFLRKTKGVTLIEMLVSLIVVSILILFIGVITEISSKSFIRVQKEAELFTDVSFAFQWIQRSVRSASSISRQPWQTGQGIGDKLVVDNAAFGLAKDGRANKTFVYLKDKDNENEGQREVILTVANSDSFNLAFDVSAESVEVQLVGKKDNIPFNLSSTCQRRIQ